MGITTVRAEILSANRAVPRPMRRVFGPPTAIQHMDERQRPDACSIPVVTNVCG